MNAETSTRAATPTGPRRVVVGIAGSIAAYKAPAIIRLLRQGGHEVTAVPTPAALHFIGAPALAAVAGHPIHTGVFDDPAGVEHVAVGAQADLVVVAPASADLLARVAAGRADDLLTATILTTTAPVVLAPAMHTQMWTNPATIDNVATLRRRGMTVIDPACGALTSGDAGVGRLPEPEVIVTRALAVMAAQDQEAARRTERTHTPTGADSAEYADLDGGMSGESSSADASASSSPLAGPSASPTLVGRHIVISAGGTREPLDPVRFLGNRSSGRQGVALAVAAADLGAQVTLIHAYVSSEVLSAVPPHVRVVSAGTAEQMRRQVRAAAASADAVIMAAAVADYRPATPGHTKLKKSAVSAGTRTLTLEFVENPDILAELVNDPPRPHPRPLVVGFAAETGDENGDVLTYGRQKARRKGADLLAINAVGHEQGFGDVPNAVVVVDRHGEDVARASGTKDDVARALMALIVQRLAA